MKGYQPIASFNAEAANNYDEVSQRGDEAETVACLERLAGGGPALELAIGTGRIALPLAARGIRVEGIDISEPMVVISGVGGQYNFVAMAHALPGARSILQLRSTRERDGRLQSNIVASYGYETIPRHLRDIVITEHGIADLRGCTDQEIIEALLAITDGRFQTELAIGAMRAGKLAPSFRLEGKHVGNNLENARAVFDDARREGLFPRFPFGTEMTQEEVTLADALRGLEQALQRTPSALTVAARALFARPDPRLYPFLERMQLSHPHSWRELVYQRLLCAALRGL